MKRLLAFFIAAALLFSALPACAQWSEAQQAEADAFFARFFARKNTVGGAVIVNVGGERRYAYFHGRAGKTAGRVTEDTAYKIASATKLLTAIGIMQLVQEGKLALDAPLQIEGKAIVNPRYPDQPVTLRQVMSHTSSIAASANYIGTPSFAEEDFYDYAPGSGYHYANLNGGILGSLIESASGQSLNAYMTEHVFAPLGINAAYAAPLLPDPDKLSNSYDAEGTVLYSTAGYMKEDAAYDDTCDPASHFRASVGGLYISLKGMEALGAALANDGVYQGVRLLKGGSVYLMQQDQASLPGSSVRCESPYGLDTYRYTLDGVTWYGHQGWWTGRVVDIFYEPQSAAAVILVMNGSDRTVGAADRAVSAQMERALRFLYPKILLEPRDMTIIDDEDW